MGWKILLSKNWHGKDIESDRYCQRNRAGFLLRLKLARVGKHGVYTCSSDGKNFKLLITATTRYSITATVSSVSSTDLVTDDGKYLVLNDNGMEHPGAVTFEIATGDVKAKLTHKIGWGIMRWKFSFFSDPTGFGMEFIFGGSHMCLLSLNQPNWPGCWQDKQQEQFP